MALTQRNIDEINNMNEAARRSNLGTVIGTLEVGSGSAPATTTVAGVVRAAATQVDSTATDVAGVVADLNALLAKLRAAGIMV